MQEMGAAYYWSSSAVMRTGSGASPSLSWHVELDVSSLSSLLGTCSRPQASRNGNMWQLSPNSCSPRGYRFPHFDCRHKVRGKPSWAKISDTSYEFGNIRYFRHFTLVKTAIIPRWREFKTATDLLLTNTSVDQRPKHLSLCANAILLPNVFMSRHHE